MDDTIYRQAAIDVLHEYFDGMLDTDTVCPADIYGLFECIPSAQPEQVIYASMSDKEFEKWLYEHGICNPNVHESIPCDAVPLLIDNAISELPSAQPDCSDCIKHGGDWDCDHVHCHKGRLPSAQPEILAYGEGELNVPDTNVEDTISRRMAIDIIQKDRETSWKDLENDNVEYKNGCDDGYAYSMQIISELPSVERKTGKWIKDEEKSADHVEPIFICSSCHNYEAWGLTECTRYCPNCGARMEEK